VVTGFWRDVAFGARARGRSKAATAAVVMTLALGIAATTVAFSVLNSFLIRPLPVRDPQRLVRVYTSYAAGPRHFTVSYPDYEDMRGLDRVFEGVLVEEPVPVALAADGSHERVWTERVSPGYFALLGLRPAHGRFFAPEEENASGGEALAVIGHGLWQRRFGGSLRVLGETLVLDGQPFPIIGVAPPGFHGINIGVFPDVWLPAMRTSDGLRSRAARGSFAMARLRSGVGVAEAAAALDVLARRLETAYPESNTGIRFTTLPESEGRVHPLVRGGVLAFSSVLLAVATLVLLLACANAAGVELARALERRKEIAVRLAMGASRGRVVRQLFAEAAALSVLAGATGVALAWVVTRALRAIPLPTARGAPLAFEVGLDGRVLGVSILAAVTTGILCGLTPALEASRCDLVAALHGTAASFARRRLHRALVTLQVGLSMALLVLGALFARSLHHARGMDLGFDPDGVAVATVDFGHRAGGPAAALSFWRTLVERLAASPAVESASLADRVPFEVNITAMPLRPEGRPVPERGWPTIDFAVVDAGYFRTMRIALLEGREFAAGDDGPARPVAIANEVLARRFWPGRSAVGQRLVPRAGPPYEVVGVVRESRYLTLGEEPKPYVYLPVGQGAAAALTLIARARGDPAALPGRMRETVRAVDDRVPVYDVGTLRDRMRLAFLPATSGAAVVNGLALVALSLTSVGLYGAVALAVARRTREIGIRRALGARAGAIVWLVARREVGTVGLGIAAGAGLGAVGSRLVNRVLYGVSPSDPLAFGVALLVLALVALLGSGIPALRAARIQPALALRRE
jgi:predicted permease